MPGDMSGTTKQTDCCGEAAHTNNAGCGIAMASSKSLSGPWKVQALNIENQWESDDVYCTHTNPTVQVLANGTWVMAFNAGFCNNHLETIGVAVSHGGWKGPWNLLVSRTIFAESSFFPRSQLCMIDGFIS